MLTVDRVRKHYGAVLAVRDVSFVVRPSEVLGYLGPNGSGHRQSENRSLHGKAA